MNINFYLHGTPTGFDFVGNPPEKDYFNNNFYSKFSREHGNGQNSSGYTELRIEGLRPNGVPAYYYTYLIGNNISRFQDARTGYIAITIRLDCYIKKAKGLTSLLDTFYNCYIRNIVFNNSRQYKVINFEGIAATINDKFDNELKNLINNYFTPEDFKDEINFPQERKVCKLNHSDASDSNVEEYFKKFGEVSISDTHPSLRTIEAIKKKEDEIADIISNHSNEIKQLEVTYQSSLKVKEDEITSININHSDEIKQLEEKCQSNLNVKEKEIALLKKNLDDLNKEFQALKTQVDEKAINKRMTAELHEIKENECDVATANNPTQSATQPSQSKEMENKQKLEDDYPKDKLNERKDCSIITRIIDWVKNLINAKQR